MLSSIRRRATYANIAATLALVFAMSGGALAASGILIKSISQIKPNVLTQIAKKAKGATGATGPQGPTGTAGTNGTNGQEGKAGKEGQEGKTGKEGPPGPTEFKSLPSGQSEHGVWYVRGPGGNKAEVPISFPIPLKEPIEETSVHFIPLHSKGGPDCDEGTLTDPKAAPGNLCVYEALNLTPEEPSVRDPEAEPATEAEFSVGKSGTFLRFEEEPGPTSGAGVWVVTQK